MTTFLEINLEKSVKRKFERLQDLATYETYPGDFALKVFGENDRWFAEFRNLIDNMFIGIRFD